MPNFFAKASYQNLTNYILLLLTQKFRGYWFIFRHYSEKFKPIDIIYGRKLLFCYFCSANGLQWKGGKPETAKKESARTIRKRKKTTGSIVCMIKQGFSLVVLANAPVKPFLSRYRNGKVLLLWEEVCPSSELPPSLPISLSFWGGLSWLTSWRTNSNSILLLNKQCAVCGFSYSHGLTSQEAV